MKILYIHQYFSTPEGKCGTRSYEFAKRLVKQGHDVHMLTSSAYLPNVEMSQKKWGHVFLDGIDVHIYNMSYSNAMPFRKRILKYVQFSFFSLFKARKIDYDIVFATSTPLTVGVPGVLSAKSRSVPFVFEVRDLWPEMPVAMGVIKNPLLIYSLKKLESWIYSNSTRVIALSPGMVNGVIATGYNSGQVSMIPNACDVEMFKTDLKKSSAFRNKYSWLEERPMILYAGTLGMINGVSYLVDVAYYLNNIDNEVRVVVIGDGMEKQHIINRAKQKNVWKKNFFLLEPMPKNDLTNASGQRNVE